MPRTQEQIEAPYTENVCAILAAFREWIDADEDLTDAAAARLIGCRPSTLSKLFAHTYPSRVAQHADAMKRIMVRAIKRARAPKRPPYVETSVSRIVCDTLEMAHLEGVIAVILGPTGVGKTCAAQAYRDREPSTLYVQGGVCASPYGLSRAICVELDLDWHGSHYDMRLAISDALRGTDRLLVIDEIDYLKEVPLQVFRMIHDGSGVGMVWIGTEGFLAKLRERRSSTINQVLGRVAYARPLGACTREDIELIAAPYKLDDPALEILAREAHGQARRAVNGLVAAQRRNGRQVTAKALRKAFRELMPVVRNGNGGS